MVLVSHPAKFIYMKTQKTGGTTVEMYFERFCAPADRYAGTEAVAETVSEIGIIGSRRGGKRDGDVWRNHMPAAAVRDLVGEGTWERYLKFSSVRNPYARMLSLYFWRTKRDYPATDRAFERARRSFARYVKGGVLRGRAWDSDFGVVAIGGEVRMDLLVRLEHLSADIEAICARLGLPWNPDWIVHTKKTAGAPRRYPLEEFYTPETASIVRREFDWVFRRFDYSLAD
jgi:hypothetical protein